MNNVNKKKKIMVIGPVYPYKGGIAHYTGLLSKTLAKKYKVITVSFSMQYPKLLFKKEQKNYEDKTFKTKKTYYWINTANPFNWLLSAKRINRYRPDMIIFQWWHPYFSPCYWVLSKLFKNTKILFLCHNVLPHERFPMDKMLSKSVLKQGDFFIVQSQKDAEDLNMLIPDANFRLTVHPTYSAFKLKNMGAAEARAKLNLNENAKVLLFFGFVREYKGLDILIEAMPYIVSNLKEVKLLVVGSFDGDKEKYIQQIKACGIKPYVDIYDEYIPDQEVEKFFAACDLVILPYKSATQSGIVQISFGFERAVVVTDVGGLGEVVEDNKTGYVVQPENPKQIAEATVKYFNENKVSEFSENIRSEAKRFSWDRMIEVVDSFWNDKNRI